MRTDEAADEPLDGVVALLALGEAPAEGEPLCRKGPASAPLRRTPGQ
ncbi:hypothetical protein ACIBU0_31565 [Streptomyces sp. NPDC049627]